MKAPHSERFSAKVITLAVQGALVAMFAVPLSVFAQEEGSEEVTALTQPTNSVEIGAEYVPKDSAKFGEYNGLDKKGADLIGNFSVRGGDAYNAFNGGSGTYRWDMKGTDLGTTSRELGGNVSDQGKWSFGIDYDELRHNVTNSYQTPFLGSMGGNNFTLPSNFGIIDTKDTRPLGVGTTLYKSAPGSNVLTAAQQADFNTPDVYSQRDNTKFNAAYIFDSQWNVKFDFNHLKQSGAKLQGVGGDQTNGNANGATSIFAGQTPFVLMNPTNYTTDTLNLALNWAGDKGYATASYFGSFFRDGYNSVSFNNPFYTNPSVNGPPFTGTLLSLPVDTMSTMPSNSLNQLNLTGGYSFTSATKLVGGISYGRNTQNDSYAQQGLTPNGFPQSSLDGLVVTTNANLKLTNQTTKDLQLTASLKYNERDNQTASNAYQFYTIQQTPILNNTTLATSVNTPMSNSKTQFDLDGDYRIDKNQKVNLAYGYEEIKRWCNGVTYPVSNPSASTGYSGPYTADTCAEVPDSKENKVSATYKLKATDALNLNAGYGYADRIADINPLFYNPMQVGGATSTPYGAGYEIPGFMAYMDASRKEQLLKAGVNWQANDKLSLGFNGRYTFDKYDSTYGVQNGNSYSLNLDATYADSEHRSFSAYATTQNKSRDMTNLQALNQSFTAGTPTALSKPAGNPTWTNHLNENDITLGLGAKQGGFMGGKLDLTGDLTYSLDKTTYGTALGYAAVDANGNTCYSAFYLTCGDLPDIKSELLQFKLVGTYTVDKVSKIKVGYLFQHLISNDYLYNTYQYGSTPTTLLPTNQQAPSYSTNVVSVSFVHTF